MYFLSLFYMYYFHNFNFYSRLLLLSLSHTDDIKFLSSSSVSFLSCSLFIFLHLCNLSVIHVNKSLVNAKESKLPPHPLSFAHNLNLCHKFSATRISSRISSLVLLSFSFCSTVVTNFLHL